MTVDLTMKALLTIDEKIAGIVRDGYPLGAAAHRVVERRPEVRINLALTESEWRVVAHALAVTMQRQEEGR